MEQDKAPVCEYCYGKGYFINEEHPKYPSVQQKIDCDYCPTLGEQDKQEEKPDMSAKEFFEGLFAMDFLTEEERQTIYDAAELYAAGKVRNANNP